MKRYIVGIVGFLSVSAFWLLLAYCAVGGEF